MTAPPLPRRWPDYGTVWRWHFYAGLLCIPFVLWLACIGSIYLWRPQIEALIDRPYADVADGGHRALASAIALAAERAVPGSILHRYQLPDTASQAVQVVVGNAAQETRVYVNPQTLGIVKAIDDDGRLMPTLFRLNGELLLGDKSSYLVELAASWAIVMILSGLFLWWPRGSGLAGVVYPRRGTRGRPLWRDIHAVAGFWMSLFALGFLVSGLPWATSWGTYLEAIRHVTAPAVARDWPLRTDLTLDAAGRILARHDFGSRPAVARLIDYGVAAHEGQLFGLANRLLNLFVAIGLVTLAISGAVLWWRRRPGDVLGAPPGGVRPRVATGFIALLIVLGLLLPLLGASMIVVLLVERFLLRRLPAASRWLGLRPRLT